MEIKVLGGTGRAGVPGLGVVRRGEWINLTDDQLKTFEMVNGYSIEDAPGIEVKSPKKEPAKSTAKAKAPASGSKKGG